MQAEFSMTLDITDPAAVIAAGRRQAILDGFATQANVRDVVAADNVCLALQLVLDPFFNPPGTEIVDSNVHLEP